MPFAVELILDGISDSRVRQMWAALDARGIPSLAAAPKDHYRPHVSLSVFQSGDADELAHALRSPLKAAPGLNLELVSVGFFLTVEAPMFLGTVPSRELLALHAIVDETLEPRVENMWPYYRPGALLPHCTLAMGVTNRAIALDAVASFNLPVAATAAGASLVEIPGGATVTTFT